MEEENKIVIRVNKHRQQVSSDDYKKLMFLADYHQRQPSDLIRLLLRKEYEHVKSMPLSNSGLSQE